MVRSAHQHSQSGFTLVELLIVFVITAFLFAASFVNLGRPQTAVNQSTTVDGLLADIKSQQNQAMLGGTSSLGAAQTYGIYIQPSQYTLFAGGNYSAGNTTNFVVTMPQGVQLSTTLLSTQAIFNKGVGNIQGLVAGSDTITITSSSGTKTITLNRFGALTVN